MKNTLECPLCGKKITSNASEGLCPECLLKGGLETGVELGEDTRTQTGPRRVKFTAPTISELETAFPQLEILEWIGQGGMGAVYKVRQKKLDRIVALKILPPDIGHEKAFADRFSREAKTLAKLNHPGIVTIHDFGLVDTPQKNNSNSETSASGASGKQTEDQGNPSLFYFLMEYVDGVNLQQLLNGNRISSREALSIVPQICDALQYAHDHGVVHRDIKPENILMDRRGHVKVADFGLAKIMADVLDSNNEDLSQADECQSAFNEQQDLTESGKVLGTPKYMSPEQIESPETVDHRSDIYALGIVFYQMLTGKLPDKNFEIPSKRVGVDVRLDEIVVKALEKNPTRRYQSVSALKTQLESVSSSQPKADKSPSSSMPVNLGKAAGFSNIPWPIWIVVSVLGLEGIANLFSIPNQPGAAIWLIAKAALITGLLVRWKIMYATALILLSIHVLYFAISQTMVAMVNLLLLILAGSQYGFYFDDSAKRSNHDSQHSTHYKSLALLSWLLALPAITFGLFFISALMSETGGWNPSPSEAFFVPFTWLCAFVLPCSGWYFWKRAHVDSLPETKSHPGKSSVNQNTNDPNGGEILSIIGVVLMLLLIATGDAIMIAVGGAIALIAGMIFMPARKLLLGIVAVTISFVVAVWAGRMYIPVWF